MRPGVALLGAAMVASCSHAADPEPSPPPEALESGMRWVSIDVDALDTASSLHVDRTAIERIEPIEVAGDVALVQLDARDLPALSQAMHEHHARCGGFVVHDTLEDARLVLAAPDRGHIAYHAVPYTLDNAATVNELLPALSESNLSTVIEQLSQSFPSRYYTSEGGLAVPQWLHDLWSSYASARPDVTVELFVHSDFEQRSVIATIPGSTKPDEVIVIGGHIDSIARGSSIAPGADDDASGIATMSEVLRTLLAKDFRPERTVKFMAYAAEEVGLRGSKAIVSDVQARAINVVGVLQLDMTLYKGSPADIYLIEDFTSAAQNTFLGTLIDTYVGATWGTTRCGYGCSDHASWHNAGFAASMPAEARLPDTNPNLHTTSDTLDASGVSSAHAIKFARLATAYVAELAKGHAGSVPNRAPSVSITSPVSDQSLSDAIPVELVATAMDVEDGDLSALIEWSSSRDGVLGRGASRSVTLTAGVHTLTAIVEDSAGAAGQATASVTVTVNDAGDGDGDDEGEPGGCGCGAGGSAGTGVLGVALVACLTRRRRYSTRSINTGR